MVHIRLPKWSDIIAFCRSNPSLRSLQPVGDVACARARLFQRNMAQGLPNDALDTAPHVAVNGQFDSQRPVSWRLVDLASLDLEGRGMATATAQLIFVEFFFTALLLLSD
jgi:hypothetical protein